MFRKALAHTLAALVAYGATIAQAKTGEIVPSPLTAVATQEEQNLADAIETYLTTKLG